MLTALVLVFVVAYAAIALEHPLKINKSASALVGAGLLWTIYAMTTGDHHRVAEELGESLMGTAQIVFFLMGRWPSSRWWMPQRLRGDHPAHPDDPLVEPDVAGGFRDLLSQLGARQPDDDHRDDLADAQAAGAARGSPVLCRHHRHRRQCGRGVVAHWRRDHDDAVDRWPDHRPGHHEVGSASFAGEPARSLAITAYVLRGQQVASPREAVARASRAPSSSAI
jgi:hypothetical protein